MTARIDEVATDLFRISLYVPQLTCNSITS